MHYLDSVIILTNQNQDYFFTSERKHDDLRGKWNI